MFTFATILSRRHGRMRGEVPRSSSPFSSPVTATKTIDRAGFRLRSRSRCGQFEDRRDTGGVVHRAVVNAVAVDRFADAEVIEVRRDDEIFATTLRVAAAQDARHVLRHHVATVDFNGSRDATGQGEVGERPAGIDECEEFAERVACALEQFVRMRRIHRCRELLARGVVQRRIGQRHRRLQTGEGRPLPRNIRCPGIVDADGPDRAGGSIHPPALADGSEVCLERAGQRPRRRVDVDDHGAAQIQPFEFVDVLFGNVEAITDEHQRRAHRRRGIDAHAEVRVLAEHQRLRFAVADKGQARLRLDDLARLEFHRLQVAVGPRRIEARALERRGHVNGSPLMFGAAGVASGHRVVRERFDVRPPPLLIRVERGSGKHEEQRSDSNPLTHAIRIPDRATMRSLSTVVDLRILLI